MKTSSSKTLRVGAGESSPRIVMNPPFINGADIKHILHARDMLRPGGRLVALCANGPRQRETLKPLASSWEDLPADTFKAEGTGVNVALLVIDAPEEPEPGPDLTDKRRRSELEAPHYTLAIQASAIPPVSGGQGDLFGATGLTRVIA